MKKLFFVSLLAVFLVSLMSSVALAGGWTSISYTETHDPNDEIVPNGIAIWNPLDDGAGGVGNDEATRSPHGSFSSTSNRCRVCHAVHMAGTASWRLLRDGTAVSGEDRGMDRASECNYCHGMTGATRKRPWRPKTYVIKGEHTLGSNDIPDDNDTNGAASDFAGTATLSCGSCHTVHGAGSLAETTANSGDPATETEQWKTRILRADPNGDGSTLAEGYNGRSTASEMAANKYATLSNFCGDCHNKNPNWNTSEDPSIESPRANPESHVQGPTANGQLEVYGTTTTVANWGSLDLNGDGGTLEPQNTQRGCRGCHAADNSGNVASNVWDVDTTGSASAWPHQTKGSKLLFDTFTEGVTETVANRTGGGVDGVLNDATRILPRMDQLCGKCHRNGGDINGGTEGVGKTF